MTMVKLEPYACTTHCLLSISDHPLPFPMSTKININPRLHDPTSLRISPPHPTPMHHPIVCARKRGWSQPSNRKMIQLVSTVAFNLRILPEPLNSLAGEIARGDSSGFRPVLNRLVGGWRGKLTRRRKEKKLEWLAFALICIAGWWSWKVSEVDLFLKASLFCIVGVSLIRVWRGKKAIKEWFLGFLFGVVLVMSSGLDKKDVKFWVQKLRIGSPSTQFTMRNRFRNWKMSK